MPSTHWIGGWVHPRTSLDVLEKWYISWLSREWSPGSSSPQPSHYTDCAILAPTILLNSSRSWRKNGLLFVRVWIQFLDVYMYKKYWRNRNSFQKMCSNYWEKYLMVHICPHLTQHFLCHYHLLEVEIFSSDKGGASRTTEMYGTNG